LLEWLARRRRASSTAASSRCVTASATPPLSVGIPALFGRRCAELRLTPPAAPFVPEPPTMAFFPSEPGHLVGRTDLLGRAARVLGDEGPAGLMFTGAAGLGKTTCAAELAYRQLPWQRMAERLGTAAQLTAFCPVLTEIAEQNALLLVIDAIEELLTSDGYWRDPRWGQVLAALLNHRGLSRLVLTGRRAPLIVPDGLCVLEVEALRAQEAVLLARQLPVLGALIRGGGGMPIAAARRVLAQVLTAAEGNPGAIVTSDRSLGGGSEGAVDFEYVELIEGWTREVG
jgi:hypothetical protein